MINARSLCLAAATAVLMTGFTTVQPSTGYAGGVNDNATRQRCQFYHTRALIGNSKARTGEITQRQRTTRWLKFKDCVGTKDYRVPLEFKTRSRRDN